jgi:branched-chain amino acid transport system permease protein
MAVFLQQTVNAISLGGIYALLALGLAVVFSIVRLINFAHGEVMTIAGYAIWLALLSSVPVAAAIALGLIVAMLASVAMERIAFRAMRGASITSLLITSFAVSEIIKVLFQNGISARPVPIVLPAWMSGSLNMGFLTISVMSVISIIVVVVSLVALSLILTRTTLGVAMRAAAEDFPVVRLVGIKANHVVALAFAISGVLAGVAAVLWVAQRGSVDPLMGAAPSSRRSSPPCWAGLALSPAPCWAASSSAWWRCSCRAICRSRSHPTARPSRYPSSSDFW